MPPRKTLRKKKSQKGGKQIYEGTQGCAQYPALKCKGASTREEGMVSKVIPGRRAVKEEMDSAKIIQTIDPEMKHSLQPLKTCDQDPSNLDPAENDINRCGVLKRVDPSEREETKLLILPEGGSDLNRLTLKPEEYLAFFETYQDLLKGVKLQHDNGIAHLDIKPGNIVSKPDGKGKFQTKQIDFGLTIRRDMPEEKMRPFIPMSDYDQWPWELRLLSEEFTREDDIGEKEWDSFANTHVIHRKERFPQEVWLNPKTHTIDEPIRNALTDMAKDQDEGSESQRKELREDILKKVDVQSLGRTLQEVQNRFTGHTQAQGTLRVNQVALDTWKKTVSPEAAVQHEKLAEGLTKPLFQLCMKMLQPVLDDRFSIDEALAFQKEKVKPKWKMFFGDRNALQEGLKPVLSWIEKPIPKVKTPVMGTPVFGERERTMFGHTNNFASVKETRRKEPWWQKRRQRRREAAATRKKNTGPPPPPPSSGNVRG